MHTAVENGGAWLIFIMLLMVGIVSTLFTENKSDHQSPNQSVGGKKDYDPKN
jgi:hypothetical protein